MVKHTSTDNSYIASKLALRRHFLRKYHAGGDARVFDCCQAKGIIWTKLRREMAIASYWGVDLKPKKGRLKIDSSRVLAQPGWTDNVIDVDVYGSPWSHWNAVLEHAPGPVTIFLTIGQHRSSVGGSLSKGAIAAMGLTGLAKVLPRGMHARLADLSVKHCLATAAEMGRTIIDAIEAFPHGNARYIGVRLC